MYFLQQSYPYTFIIFSLVRLPIPNMTYSISTLRKMSATTCLPLSFQTMLRYSHLPGVLCSVMKPQNSLHMHLPEPSGVESAKQVPGRSRPILHACHGAVHWAGACLYTPRPCSEQHVPEHTGQGAIHKLFKILSRPKAQRHCTCCTQYHGVFS